MREFQRIRQRQHASRLGEHALRLCDQIRPERMGRLLPVCGTGIRTSRQDARRQRKQDQSSDHVTRLRSARAPLRTVLHAGHYLTIDEIGNRVAPNIHRGVHGAENRMPGSVHQRV